MSITTSRFTNEKAPCGQIVDGERFRDRDEECLLSDELFYDCGLPEYPPRISRRKRFV